MAVRSNSESGGVFVQLTIFLPIFVSILFFLIWLGTTLQARTVLIQAVAAGAAKGQALGDKNAANRGTFAGDPSFLAKVDAFDESDDTNNVSSSIFADPMLSFSQPSGGTSKARHQSLLNTQFNSRVAVLRPPANSQTRITGSISNVPGSYVLAMAIAYQTMKDGLGSARVKFPCSFSQLNSIPGCLACIPSGVRSPDNMVIGGGNSLSSQCLTRAEVNIECFYHASFAGLDSLIALLNIFNRSPEPRFVPLLREGTVPSINPSPGFLLRAPVPGC